MPTFVEPPESSGGGSGYSEGDDPSFGTITATSKVSLPDGTNSAPSLTNTGDTDTGIYFPAADTVSITTGGTKRFDVTTTSVDVALPVNFPAGSDSGPSIAYSSDTDTGIYFSSAKVAVTVSGTEEVSVGTNGMQLTSSLGVGTGASGTTGEIRATNDITAFYSSDKRLKDNIVPITEPLSKISQLGGYTFDWIPKEGIHSHEGRDVGVIAQEVEEVLPEVTTTRHNGYKAVKYEKIVPLLIECIKAQQSQIDELKETLSELKK